MSEKTLLGLKHTKTIPAGKAPAPRLAARMMLAYFCIMLALAELNRSRKPIARTSGSHLNTPSVCSTVDILVVHLVTIAGHTGLSIARLFRISHGNIWNQPTCALGDNSPSPSNHPPLPIHLCKYLPGSLPPSDSTKHDLRLSAKGTESDERKNGVTVGAIIAPPRQI